MKKKLLISFLSVLYFISNCVVYAYDVKDENLSSVYNDRQEIYLLKDMYDSLVGKSDEKEEIVYEVVNSDNYWWPIGSVDSTTVNGKLFALGEPDGSNINSGYSFRYFNGQLQLHGGIDIGASSGINTNIIASKSGRVVYPTKSSKTDYMNFDPDYNSKYCINSSVSYGNYVMIQHDDGNYTLYGHLSPNSITVSEGDRVEQGQVIAKMGSSGCSTGAHLHFEMRIGSQSYSSIDNPLKYVKKDDPRPSESYGSISFDQLVEYVFNWEGSTPSTDTEYIAVYGDKLINIGHGVTWENTRDFFEKYGITEMHIGSHVSKAIADQVAIDVLKYTMDKIKSDLAAKGIDGLKDYQILALASQSYNGGYVVIKDSVYGYDFITAYLKHNGKYSFEDIYKHQSSIWYDAMCRPYSPGTDNQLGLQRRRVSEWRLFTTGEIDYYPLNTFNPNEYAWPE